MEGKAMHWTAVTELLVAFLSVSGVRGQNGWSVTYSSSQICTIKGSTVDLKCNYTHPDTVGDTVIEVRKLIWYTKGDNYAPVDLKDDQDYAGRIKYKHGCTVAIRDVRESDSAVYKFRFITNHQNGKYTGSPGVTLSVSAVELQVIKWEHKQSGTLAEMTCKSKCLSDLHPYIWVKNGQDVLTQTSSSFSYTFSDADRISCAAAGHRNFPSPSVYMPNLPSVSMSSSGHIVEGDPINLTCSSDANPAATYTWYKKDTSGPISKGSQLVFKSIQSSDSGEYYCKAQNVLRIKASKVVFIDVKYAPRLPSVALRPSGEVVRGTSVNLICSSDANPTAEYIWFKKNNPEPLSNDSQLVFESIQSSDSGEYYCTSENMLNQVTSEGMFIDVKYPPSFPIVSRSFSGEVVEGDSLTLACSADANPAATYTWYKEHEANPLSKGPKLVFRSVQSSDSGKYFCAAENVLKRMTSGSILIDVEYAPNLPRISLSASEIMEGISLTLSCSSDSNPAANYTWFKEKEKMPQSSGQNLTITNIGRQHSGLYFCEAHNSRGSHKSAIHLTVAARNRNMTFKMMNITKLAAAALLLLTLLFVVSLWTRKKKPTDVKTESKEHVENIELDLCPEYENISTLRSFIASHEEREKQTNPT
ncbi:carcinoembryonic antigen-related cell adhesion molecule 5-like isoform X1 [Poecilia latipinna]|uniref:carcinoembryonic antigen-related cell adhesion molecule 5-like isoform X1 n=1 Tax=Poecilia latipinna TaxID=48699 RepID=UPI00072EC370|nr:PREDICTED: carcinoembryonic antigen-related cell adhesion molecule 5-like isoform X1 [Poecilia latipinna]